MFDIDLSHLRSNNQKQYVLKQTKDLRPSVNYNAFYSAIVVNTNDFYNLGRIQIRIPSIHGVKAEEANYIKDESLPWAKPGIFNAGGNDMGQFLIPEKGSRVFVTFEANDSSNPIYFGGIPTLLGKKKEYNDNPDIYSGENVDITDNDKIKDLKNDKAKQVVYKSFKGATIIIDDKDGQENIKLIDASGQVFEMGVLNPTGTPLPRRGDKEYSTDPYRYIRLGNKEDFIKIVDGKISIVSDDVEINGHTSGGGSDEVEISNEQPTDKNIELWVDLDDNELPLPEDVVTDPNYVHTDNNFSDFYMTKLDNIESEAEKNKIDYIYANGSQLEIQNKRVNIIIPTKTSDLTNNSNFISDSNYIHTDNNFTNEYKQQISNNTSSITTLQSETLEITSNINTLNNNKLNKNFTDKVITNISVEAQENSNVVNINKNIINPSTNETSSEINPLPLVSETSAGLMTKESYAQIIKNTSDIESLKSTGGKFIGIGFNTYVELEAYVIPDTVNINDFTFVRNDEEHGNDTTRYIVTLKDGVKTFEFAYVINEDTYGNFQNGTAGFIVGNTEEGTVFAEADGTGSVVGWDELKSKVTNNTSKLNGIEEGAQVNKIEIIQKNGVPLEINDKTIDIIVPTKTSDLTNDSNFIIDNNYVHTDNNFTTQLLNKLNGIENNAQVNKIEIIKVNNSNLEIQNKSVNINVPTKLSDLQNDMNFITSSDSITGNAATATKLQNSVKINGVTFDGTQDININISGVGNAVSYKNTNNLVANLPIDL